MKKIFTKITFPGLLSAFSFTLVLFVLLLYILGNVLSVDSLNNIFNNAWERGFVWLIIILVLLCNLDHIREIVKSAVREKMDSLVVSDIREEIVYKIENDPDMLRKLSDAASKKEKQSFNNPINGK